MMIAALIIITAIIAFVILLNAAYKRTNYDSNESIFYQGFCNRQERGHRIANIGSTYAKYAFGEYDDLGVDGVNMALKSESLEIDYCILKEYSKCLKENAIVFIPVSPCLMLFDDNSTNRNRLYQLLSKKNNPEFSLFTVIKRWIPLVFNPRKVKYLIKDSEYKANDIYELRKPYVCADKAKEELDSLVEIWLSLFGLENLRSTELSDKNISVLDKNKKILKQIIQLCIDEGFKPVVITTPFSDYLNSFFSKEFKNLVLYECIYDAKSSFDFIFLDYLTDPFYGARSELFVDGGFCLNKRGSMIFVKSVLDRLEKEFGISVI